VDALDAMIGSWTKTKEAFALRDQLQGAEFLAASFKPARTWSTIRIYSSADSSSLWIILVSVASVLPNFPLQFTNAKLTRRWEFPVLGETLKRFCAMWWVMMRRRSRRTDGTEYWSDGSVDRDPHFVRDDT
jgi:hypothetical protein